MSRARDVASRDIVDGSITNADINDSAAIATSKLAANSITINGTAVSLGGSATIQGESFSPFMLMGA